jgi:hypothetical protein
VQFAVAGNGNLAGHGAAGGVFSGGLSGVAFGAGVELVSRVTQGCQPVGPTQRITAADGNVVLELDGKAGPGRAAANAGCFLAGRSTGSGAPHPSTLAGLTNADSAVASGRTGHFGNDTRVRHILGLDGARQGVALADTVEPGMLLAFCQRNAGAARADLVRICTEIREELTPEETEPSAVGVQTSRPVPGAAPALAPGRQREVAGAIYVSCSGRGGPHLVRRVPSCRSCATPWVMCPWSGFSLPAKSRAISFTDTPAC